MKFYTNASVYKNKILVTGYENGRRFKEKVSYKPYLFLKAKSKSKYKTIHNEYVDRVDFDSINDARDFIKQYKDVDGFEVYGLDKFLYTYLYDEFLVGGNLDYDPNLVNIGYIDIETFVDEDTGFPDIQAADNEVTLVSIEVKDHIYTLGCGDFDSPFDDVTYIKCRDETHLLRRFVEMWERFELDIITGWNIAFFDIPYLVNRIRKILGQEYANRLSPWGILRERMIETQGKEQQTFVPDGISVIDYMDAYKKFGYKQQESYALGNVCEDELGETKIEYEGSLIDLQNGTYKFEETSVDPAFSSIKNKTILKQQIKKLLDQRGVSVNK